MRDVLLVTVGVLSLFSTIPYVLDILKGKSKPNIASWSTWTLLNVIIIVSALAAGEALNTVVLGISFLIGSSSILLIALFKGTRGYTLFDGSCQAIAILGVVLWQLSNNPDVALLFVILIDIFAIFPTFRHAYRYPYEETWITYFISGIAALALTALVTTASFASLAVTIEASLTCFIVVGVILYRRPKIPIQ